MDLKDGIVIVPLTNKKTGKLEKLHVRLVQEGKYDKTNTFANISDIDENSIIMKLINKYLIDKDVGKKCHGPY